MEEITEEQLLAWIGSDNTKESMIELLLDIANGNYNGAALGYDVLDYQYLIKE